MRGKAEQQETPMRSSCDREAQRGVLGCSKSGRGTARAYFSGNRQKKLTACTMTIQRTVDEPVSVRELEGREIPTWETEMVSEGSRARDRFPSAASEPQQSTQPNPANLYHTVYNNEATWLHYPQLEIGLPCQDDALRGPRRPRKITCIIRKQAVVNVNTPAKACTRELGGNCAVPSAHGLVVEELIISIIRKWLVSDPLQLLLNSLLCSSIHLHGVDVNTRSRPQTSASAPIGLSTPRNLYPEEQERAPRQSEGSGHP
jgi:hypothetical protein